MRHFVLTGIMCAALATTTAARGEIKVLLCTGDYGMWAQAAPTSSGC